MRLPAKAAALGILALVLAGSGWAGARTYNAAPSVTDGGYGSVDSVSCVGIGECTSGGYYHTSRGTHAFVVSETNGSWGSAIKIPGVEALSTGGDASADSISCTAVGECAAAGSYYVTSVRSQAFVVSETNGTWGKAIEVPGSGKLNTGGEAYVNSISCGAAGDCSAGGVYYDSHHGEHAFLASETNGTWGKAIKVPGLATLERGDAEVDSISCAAPGECTAGGQYQDGFDSTGGLRLEVFVVSETNGSWGTAIEVPGTATLNTHHNAAVSSVSCAAAGQCAVGGSYVDSHSHSQAFVASQTNGNWSTAIEVPGTATLNSGGEAQVNSVSCAAAGECTAAGYYSDSKSGQQPFVVAEASGSWGTAIKVPGTAGLNGSWVELDSISCPAVDECSAGGIYVDDRSRLQVFVAGETSGTWGTAIAMPGTAPLNVGGDAQVYDVSCAAPGECASGGFYDPLPGSWKFERPFVANETNGSWSDAARVSGLPALCLLPQVVGKALRKAEKSLNTAGCRLGKIAYVHSKLPRGHVVAQRPKPGPKSMFGRFPKFIGVETAVVLTVSKGRKP